MSKSLQFRLRAAIFSWPMLASIIVGVFLLLWNQIYYWILYCISYEPIPLSAMCRLFLIPFSGQMTWAVLAYLLRFWLSCLRPLYSVKITTVATVRRFCVGWNENAIFGKPCSVPAFPAGWLFFYPFCSAI